MNVFLALVSERERSFWWNTGYNVFTIITELSQDTKSQESIQCQEQFDAQLKIKGYVSYNQQITLEIWSP